ncbi:hypothetical protein Taro_028903, partial [Colocasia esculenta]|nr:hypothetical protein [Colocasia esculenta]
MVAIVGAKEGGPVDVGVVAGGVIWEITKSWPTSCPSSKEVVEQVGDLEQAGVVAWGCGLCQGHFLAAAAAAVVVVTIAGTVVRRAETVVVVVAVVVVVVVAAAVASAVAAVASDP